MSESFTDLDEMRERFSTAFELGRLERRCELLEQDLSAERIKRATAERERAEAERERDDYRRRLALCETEQGIAEMEASPEPALVASPKHATLPFRLFIIRGERRMEGARYRTRTVASIFGNQLAKAYPKTTVEIVRDGEVVERIGA